MKLNSFFNYILIMFISVMSGILLESLPFKSIYLLIVYIIFFVWFGYKSLLYAFDENAAYRNIKLDIETRDSKLDFNISNFPPFAFVITFGLICKQLYHIDKSLFNVIVTNQKNVQFESQWMIFAIDNFIRVVLFDFLETYHIHISNINSKNLFILSFIFIFKTILSIFFIKSLTNLIKSTRKVEFENK